VQHELHAAAFVEEPFGDHSRLRGHAAEHRAARHHEVHGLLCAEGIQAAVLLQPRDCRRGRRLPPARVFRPRIGREPIDRLPDLRDGRRQFNRSRRRFARQNGIVGVAPRASSTSTRPDPTRRIRQDVLPSRKMSPAKLSTAKSSSTVPTTLPSGCWTTL
jgi:hypothetical protein